MKLSICVITMNRAAQLEEALKSCLTCDLSDETEFVIIDNASTDNTEQAVHALMTNCGYKYYYEKLPKNLGVGGGRNYAYEKSCGEYVYMLDDDAVIDCENGPRFFTRATEILDKHQDIVTLTTQIYDTAWQKNRLGSGGPIIEPGLHKCMMFCGGSHFLRKAFFCTSPYLPNKYGYEEIPPSLRAFNAGKTNAFSPELLIIHKPIVDKWNWNDQKNHDLLIKEIALPYAIKKMMYPKIALPLLKLAKSKRMKRYTKQIPNAKRRVKDAIESFCTEYPIDEKIKLSTLVRIFKEFKLSVF